jgi:hypothetical protein
MKTKCNLKKNESVVIFEEYSEYNQFEGGWTKEFRFFTKDKEAIEYIEILKSNPIYRDIYGPLKQLRTK